MRMITAALTAAVALMLSVAPPLTIVSFPVPVAPERSRFPTSRIDRCFKVSVLLKVFAPESARTPPPDAVAVRTVMGSAPARIALIVAVWFST